MSHAGSQPAGSVPDDAEAAALWRAYRADGDPRALVLHYRGLVERIAARTSLDLPSFVERCDLVSYGILGLVDALRRFDPDRAVKFETYASARIQGAIVDGLRSLDWIPRSVRTKLRAVARAETTLQTTLGRAPTESELAAEVGMSVAGLRKLSGEAALRTVVRLDDERLASVLDRTSSPADQPGQALEAAERARAVACALERLDDRDRTVIHLYYYRGLKLTEIGRMLGVTEARVSQLHTRARSTLRRDLLAMDL